MKGWIKLHREIQDTWLWEEKPFSKSSAWIDILLLANHQDNKIIFDSNLIEVKRGSFITSIRGLCERWGWSNSKVKKFLEVLQNDEMISYKSDTKKTTINIVNYEVYQTSSDTENATETSQKHHRNITETPQKHTNKNDKNDKNEKELNIYDEIFQHYLSLNLIKHKSLTPSMKKAIDKAIEQNKYTVDEMKLLLNRHKEIVDRTKDNEYPIKMRTLEEFFGQKIQGATSLICTQYDMGGKYYSNDNKKDENSKQEQYRRFEFN